MKRISVLLLISFLISSILNAKVTIPAVPRYLSIQDFYKYVKGDSKLDPAKKKKFQKLIGTVGTITGITTLGSTYWYFFKHRKKKRGVSSVQQENKGVLQGNSREIVSNASPSLDQYKLNGKKVLLVLDGRFEKQTSKLKQINKLKEALATNNIEDIQRAIKKNALYHSEAEKLLWNVQSEEAALYIIANYPGDKSVLVNYPKDETDEHSETFLQYAMAKNENSLLVQVLIDEGANVNVREKDTRMVPLMKAAEAKNTRLLVQLVEHGAILTIQDKNDKYFKTYAIESFGRERAKFLQIVKEYKEQYPIGVQRIEEWVNSNSKKNENKNKNRKKITKNLNFNSEVIFIYEDGEQEVSTVEHPEKENKDTNLKPKEKSTFSRFFATLRSKANVN